jgi:hypothetical protein
MTEASMSMKTKSMTRCLLQDIAGVFSWKCVEPGGKISDECFSLFFLSGNFLKIGHCSFVVAGAGLKAGE